MGRKKLKRGENIVTIRGYVKQKHADRVKRVLQDEIDKIKLEELLVRSKEPA